MNSKKNKPVIFTHIPKASGSTIVLIAQQEYGKKNLFRIRVNDTLNEISAGLEEKYFHDGKEFIATGHLGLGIHKILTFPVHYMTMLRDPISLVVSRYYYRKNHPKPQSPVAIHAKQKTLEEFIDDIEDNTITRFISGVELQSQMFLDRDENSFHRLQTERICNDKFSDLPCTEENLRVAKVNLTETITSFGLTERFDESLILFKKELGWKRIHYVRQNVGRVPDARGNMPLSTLEKIRCKYKYDIQLYDYATELFNQRIREHGQRFFSELDDFRRLNPIYGRFNLAAKSINESPQWALKKARTLKKNIF